MLGALFGYVYRLTDALQAISTTVSRPPTLLAITFLHRCAVTNKVLHSHSALTFIMLFKTSVVISIGLMALPAYTAPIVSIGSPVIGLISRTPLLPLFGKCI
jgi:hypothetical protein